MLREYNTVTDSHSSKFTHNKADKLASFTPILCIMQILISDMASRQREQTCLSVI